MERFYDIGTAYFSMEFALENDMHTYAGGLGVLAADMMRGCADLEIGIAGVSLLVKKGYFFQTIDAQGVQHEKEDRWNPHEFLTPLNAEVSVTIEDRQVRITPWLYGVKGVTGFEVPVIFLDTDNEANSPFERSLSYYLYKDDDRFRCAQEIVLGVGGVRMLEALGFVSDLRYHMNEGHSAFLVAELMRKFGDAADPAREVRNRCIFTTHTPVPAGHDKFSTKMVQNMFPSMPEEIQKSMGSVCNMTELALNHSAFVNGVAGSHTETTSTMFPGHDIESITNGIHTSYWVCPSMDELFGRYVKSWRKDFFNLRYIAGVSCKEIMEAHRAAKERMIAWLFGHQKVNLNPDVFTIGYARRITPYKRADMLFSDMQRLKSIAQQYRGLQILYSGIAHPADREGKRQIEYVHDAMKALRPHVRTCYIEDYDLQIAGMMVSGCDLWLNTPRPPQEASGTSGMKAAANGVPQLSVLDGWWNEGHIENITGWSIGKRYDENERASHAEELEDMYGKLEHTILPLYYNNPEQWARIMRNCISINGSFFNTHRMVRQYVVNAYFTHITEKIETTEPVLQEIR
ncbi:MAG: alpha-glucan family phosphorylase [Chitinivibrionales bacterium]|nr:alpha-glucan family phosphorylase [Chitinivibrionales bacterium]